MAEAIGEATGAEPEAIRDQARGRDGHRALHDTRRALVARRDSGGLGAGRAQAGALAPAASASERLAPQTMRLIGTTQLGMMLVGFLSIAPAIT